MLIFVQRSKGKLSHMAKGSGSVNIHVTIVIVVIEIESFEWKVFEVVVFKGGRQTHQCDVTIAFIFADVLKSLFCQLIIFQNVLPLQLPQNHLLARDICVRGKSLYLILMPIRICTFQGQTLKAFTQTILPYRAATRVSISSAHFGFPCSEKKEKTHMTQ